MSSLGLKTENADFDHSGTCKVMNYPPCQKLNWSGKETWHLATSYVSRFKRSLTFWFRDMVLPYEWQNCSLPQHQTGFSLRINNSVSFRCLDSKIGFWKGFFPSPPPFCVSFHWQLQVNLKWPLIKSLPLLVLSILSAVPSLIVNVMWIQDLCAMWEPPALPRWLD